MKRLCVTIITLCLLTLTACEKVNFMPQGQEMALVAVVQLLTVDRTEDGQYRLGAIFVSEKGKSSDIDGRNAQLEYISSTAPTVAQAEEELQAQLDKNLFWGHADYCILGNRAMSGNISASLDYLMRSPHIRLGSQIFIAPGDASELAQKGIELPYSLVDYMDVITVTHEQLAQFYRLFLMDFIAQYLSEYTAIAVPMIEIEHDKVLLNHYAIVREEGIVGVTNETAGFNPAHNLMRANSIPIEDRDGQLISLRLLQNSTTIEPIVTGGILVRVDVICHVESSIGENEAYNLDLSGEMLAFMEQQQADYVRRQIEDMFTQSQELNADYLQIWSCVWRQHPIVWEGIRDDWDSIYPQLPITVTVDSRIVRAYDLEDINKEGIPR